MYFMLIFDRSQNRPLNDSMDVSSLFWNGNMYVLFPQCILLFKTQLLESSILSRKIQSLPIF